MMPSHRARALIFSVILTTSTLAIILSDPASAQGAAAVGAAGALRGASVGTFRVAPDADGAGIFQGKLVAGHVDATGGGHLIRDLAVASAAGSGAAATRVFDSIDVQGYRATSNLAGVGTSALTLEGEGLSIELLDNVNSLLVVRATGSADQVVSLVMADGIGFRRSPSAPNVYDVVVAGDGGFHGALVLVASTGQQANAGGATLAEDGAGRATVTLKQGTQLVFRADTSYATAGEAAAEAALSSYNAAVIQATASGRLAGEATTELTHGAALLANANAFLSTRTHTDTSAAHRVTTTLKAQTRMAAGAAATTCAGAQASGPAASATAAGCGYADILAYDLAYVDVPAQTADNVAVYLDGALAQKMDAAADVATHSQSYWSTTVDGRVLVLANAAMAARSAVRVTVVAVPSAQAAAATLAQLDAQTELRGEVQGGFELLGSLQASQVGSGQVIGTFSTFLASEARGDASVSDVTDIRTSTEVFTKIHFAADVAADATAEFTTIARSGVAGRMSATANAVGGAAVRMVTSVDGSTRVVAEFSDSVYATIRAHAEVATQAELHLGNDVRATALADAEQVVALDGPAGRVGHVIIAAAEPGVASQSRFDLATDGVVRAHLEEGETLVFRSASDAHAAARAEFAARAIARGILASEIAVRYAANAVTSAEVDHRAHVHSAVRSAAAATHRGQVTLDVASDVASRGRAALVMLVADQATLAARQAEDITVTVDGRAAVLVATAAEVVAAVDSGSAGAVAFVTTNAWGNTQAIVSLPSMAAGSTSSIVFASRLEAQSRLNAAVDVFGSFHAGYGGMAQGDIVSLIARPEAALLLDYTVAARKGAEARAGTVTTVFDAVRLGTSAFTATSAASSNALQFESDEWTIEAFDVSSAVLKLTAKSETVAVFDLAENLRVEAEEPRVLMIDGPDFSGAVILVGAATAQASGSADANEGSTLVGTPGARTIEARLAAGSELIFKAFSGFESQLTDAERRAQAVAIASGTLIGQVTVRTIGGLTSATVVNYYPTLASSAVVGSEVQGGATGSLVGMGAVQAITQVASADKVELVVRSATSTAKSIVLSLDRATVAGLVDGDAELLLDGQRVRAAESYIDALTASEDTYILMTGGGEVGLQALVTLGHFSTRTITLESPPPPSIFLWTTIALAVVTVGQAVYPSIRKRMA